MVKIIQRRVKHAKVLPCVFFIPLRMRVRDNIIILYTEVDSNLDEVFIPPLFIRDSATIRQSFAKSFYYATLK